MATDRHNEHDSRSLARCAACSATVITQIDCRESADANTVCATCGMTLVDPPFARSSDPPFSAGCVWRYETRRSQFGSQAPESESQTQASVVRGAAGQAKRAANEDRHRMESGTLNIDASAPRPSG